MTAQNTPGRKRKFLLIAIALIVLVGGVVADRFLKGKGHAGVLHMAKQLVVNYPNSWAAEAPHVKLTLSEKSMASIQAVVDASRERGVILAEGNDYVKGKVTDSDGTFKAKLRIKGKMTDHVKGEKWSFRVIAKDSGDFLGMRRFSLQHPGTRAYLTDWLHHQMMRGEGVVALRYGFCTVELNEKDLGVYAYEEHFGQELLDNNNRPRGPILRFDPSDFWQKRLAWMRKEKPDPNLGVYRTAKLDAYDTKEIMADSTRKAQFDTAVVRIQRFRNGEVPAHQVFDADLLARHLAHNDLIGGFRSVDWSDVKFYFNPSTGLVEPVAYESFSGYPTTDLIGDRRGTQPFSVNDDLHVQWMKDDVIYERYLHHLRRFSEPSYLDSTFTALGPALEQASAIVYKEFPWKELNKALYYQNQLVIKRWLEKHQSTR